MSGRRFPSRGEQHEQVISSEKTLSGSGLQIRPRIAELGMLELELMLGSNFSVSSCTVSSFGALLPRLAGSPVSKCPLRYGSEAVRKPRACARACFRRA